MFFFSFLFFLSLMTSTVGCPASVFQEQVKLHHVHYNDGSGPLECSSEQARGPPFGRDGMTSPLSRANPVPGPLQPDAHVDTVGTRRQSLAT